MTHDDYTRILSELQGGLCELTSCAVAGRPLVEALQSLEPPRQRARDLADEFRKRADALDDAVSISLRVAGAVNEG